MHKVDFAKLSTQLTTHMKDAFSGEPMPSMTQNLTEGNYLDLALQGLGVAGDTAYGIPLAGPFIGGGLILASVLGPIN
jgi:hypothetical protein